MRLLRSRLIPIVGTVTSLVALVARAAPTCLSEAPCDASSGSSPSGDIDGPSLVKRAVWSPAQGGCWSDNVNNRALEIFLGSFDDLTPAKCQTLCDVEGFFLSGVEFASECFCGNTIFGDSRPISNAICNAPCNGDTNQFCGGTNAIYIYVKDNYQYTTGPATLLSAYNGFENPRCWSDSVNNRVFTGRPFPEIPGDLMTVQRCVDGCAAAGFSAAGLEYNRECFCGNTNTPASDAVDINECNSPCFGDASQFCGGGNRILVYSKTYYPPPPPPPSNPNPAPNPPPSPTSSSSTPTPTFVTYRGRIQVTNTANNVPLGFLAKNLDSVGHYQYTASQNNAMIVTFQAPLGATSVTRQQLTTVNGASSFPLLGLVQGRDDINGNLATGSYQYVYFASTNPSAPGATPQNGGNSYTAATGTVRTYESSVWNINLVTGAASVQWINTDSSTPTTFLFTQSMVLYGGADPAAFFARYPAPVTNILLTFVPLP